MPSDLLLTLAFPPMGGGVARWMYEIARRYPAPGLVVSTASHPDAADVDGTLPQPVDRLPISAKRLKTLQGLMLWARRSAVLARSHRARFTWCGDIHPAGYPAKWTLERVGTPLGILLHGPDLLVLQHQVHRSAMKRRSASALLGAAAVLVANSEWTRGLAQSLLRELELEPAGDRIRVVPLGTDPAFFRPGESTAGVQERYGLEEGRWIVSVSRLAAHRGIDVVLRALALLDDREADVRYAVAGTGDARRELEQLAAELGLDRRVRFLGGVAEGDLPGLYNLAEVYVAPARRAPLVGEGFGLALAEASSAGRPVIAARAGGVPEAVRDGQTGLLVDPHRPSELADALRRLLRDRTLARKLGTAGRREIERYYNWDRVASDLAQIAADAAGVGTAT
ncbi:MAG TPA: glycosyltransferase [Gemmatimonadales bacterium]|nr:glycosyltransferase [Gemmatimonadales bacterium]